MRLYLAQPVIRVNVRSCERCGLDHDDVTVRFLANPRALNWHTHWFMCPKIGEPVTLGIGQVEAKEISDE